MAVGRSTGLATALHLAELGAVMVEARYRREHPAASDDDVAAHVRSWWLARPGAPSGDYAAPDAENDTAP